VYLRFHYVVDLLTGAVVVLAGWGMGEKYEASTGSLQMLSSRLNNRQQPARLTRRSPHQSILPIRSGTPFPLCNACVVSLKGKHGTVTPHSV
jgi:hypothetical protein